MRRYIAILGLLMVNFNVTGFAISPYLPEIKKRPYKTTAISPKLIKLDLPGVGDLRPAQYATIKSLNGDWKFSGIVNSSTPFSMDANIDSGYATANFNDSNWDDIKVPMNWYVQYPKARLNKDESYLKAWYRHKFTLTPTELKDHRVILRFGVIGYSARLFVNGHDAGSHHGDFTPWTVDVTPYVTSGVNSIAIRVFSDLGASRGNLRSVTHAYGAQWSPFSLKAGIWQDVELILENPVWIRRVLVTPSLANSTIKVNYLIENTTKQAISCNLGAAVSSALIKDSNRVDGMLNTTPITLKPGKNHGSISVRLTHPQLWSPDNPYLYYLTLYLREADKILTANATRFGYRDFNVKGKNFYLNGERIYLYGENFPSSRYEDRGYDKEKEIATLAKELTGYKSLGYNIIRPAHAPTSTRLYRIADEIGLMIYDEWGWCFNKEIDEPAFERNNLDEITEWVYRDYNHPSVVMWSCGNEVRFADSEAVKRQLNKEVDWVKNLDLSGRPAGVFSGSGTWKHYGKDKLNTDFIDLHNYTGLGTGPWTTFADRVDECYQFTAKTYAENGKFNKPYIIWECIGFSWGGKSDRKFEPNNIYHYARYATNPTSWGAPNGIGFAGTIGLTAALDPDSGLYHGKRVYGRRILERVRQNPDIQGFAPWFHGSYLKMAANWNQPVFCGLRDKDFIPLRNVFSNRAYKQTLFVVNNTKQTLDNAIAEISLAFQNGKVLALNEIQLPKIDGWRQLTHEITLSVPETIKENRGQLRITLKQAGKIISRNFYYLYIQSPNILTQPIKIERQFGVLNIGAKRDVDQLVNILSDLGVNAPVVDANGPYKDVDVLIVPPALSQAQPLPAPSEKLIAWIREGGVFVLLEQRPGSLPIRANLSLDKQENTFVDLAVPGHPVFKGLDQNNFDTWNGVKFGYVIKTAINPFTLNSLAVAGSFLGQRRLGTAIFEGIWDKGRLFMSQVQSVSCWGRDSAASVYLRNLIGYLGAGKPYKGVLPLSNNYCSSYPCLKKNLMFVDLKPYANRGFSDENDNDGKGGWTDQGANDFREMPLGKQEAAGVPFHIIDPAKNDGKSCLILRGSARPNFPAAIRGVNVGQKLAYLYFLHTCAWGKGREAGVYRINYADGSHVDHRLLEGRDTGDWWNHSTLSNAIIGFTRENASGHRVGVYVNRWSNPYPQKTIASIDFLSSDAANKNKIDYITPKNAVPILVAITGEKPHANPIVVAPDNKWSAIGWKGGAKPTISPIPGGGIKANMPAPRDGGMSVIMTKSPTQALQNDEYHYLSFLIKSETFGLIDLVIPNKDWSKRLLFTIPLEHNNEQWKRIRIDLKKKLNAKTFPLKNLRGELFIYNGSINAAKRQSGKAAVIYLKDIKFE